MFFKIGKNKGPHGETLHDKHGLASFPLRPLLPLPKGVSRDKLFDWMKTVRVEDAPASILDYCTQDFERFLYTFGLVQHVESSSSRKLKGLELGANPYFTTMLLKHYTPVDWSLANYFSDRIAKGGYSQGVDFSDPDDIRLPRYLKLEYSHFNIEEDEFPFPTASFDIVLFCEIIEHLLMDPCAAIREIRRVLRNDGTLILTTPNVNRLENVARMITGANMYDPYSGYGPYGRHNREYNKHELYLLLSYLGFTIDEIFTADVHQNNTEAYLALRKFGQLVEYRKHDLGQYIFVRARKTGQEKGKKPSWLYRSYLPEHLE